MTAQQQDLERLVFALMRLSDGVQRAKRQVTDPARQAVLQAAATADRVRPSDIAEQLSVHQSSVSRQVRALEEAGLVTLEADPQDRRSCLISLTASGWDEAKRLTQLGLDAFAEFVADWSAEDVRTLADLLNRLEGSVAQGKETRRARPGRHWQRRDREAISP